MDIAKNGLIIRRRDFARKVGVGMQDSTDWELDRQAKFERRLYSMNNDDWFVSDEHLEQMGVIEYRMYEQDCFEVEIENAD